MSGRTIKFLLKYNVEVCKNAFFGNTKILGFQKSNRFFMGFRVDFGFQTGIVEIVKNHFSNKRK